jgi:hypothetical protein
VYYNDSNDVRQNVEIKNFPCNTGKHVIDSVTSLFKINCFCSQIRTHSVSCCYVRKRKSTCLYVRTYLSTCDCLSVCLFICLSMYLSVYICTLIYYIDSSPSIMFPVLFVYLFIHHSADILLMHFKSNGFVRCLVVYIFIDYAFKKMVKLFKSTHDITIPGQDLAVVP